MGPCFEKVPLKEGCKLIATIDMMFSTITLVGMICTTIAYAIFREGAYEEGKKFAEERERPVPKELETVLGYFDRVIIIMSVATILFFVLAILLYIASIQDSIVKLRIWVGINFILMILSIFTFSFLLIIILVIYKLYSIWVVMSLVGEIQDGTRNVNNGIVHSSGQHGAAKNSFEV